MLGHLLIQVTFFIIIKLFANVISSTHTTKFPPHTHTH